MAMRKRRSPFRKKDPSDGINLNRKNDEKNNIGSSNKSQEEDTLAKANIAVRRSGRKCRVPLRFVRPISTNTTNTLQNVRNDISNTCENTELDFSDNSVRKSVRAHRYKNPLQSHMESDSTLSSKDTGEPVQFSALRFYGSKDQNDINGKKSDKLQTVNKNIDITKCLPVQSGQVNGITKSDPEIYKYRMKLRRNSTKQQKEIFHNPVSLEKNNDENALTLSEAQRQNLKKLSLSKTFRNITLTDNRPTAKDKNISVRNKNCSRMQLVPSNRNIVSPASNGNTKLEISSENLTNKADAIEQILNLEEDPEVVEIIETKKDTDKKIHKFFHKNQNTTNSIAKRNNSPNLRLRSATKNKSIQKQAQNEIYDFLSQSQISDPDISKKIDPAADIIKRMITEGKVAVATNRKGTGRPRIKRKVNVPKKRAIKGNNVRQVKTKENIKNTNLVSSSGIDDNDYDDHFHYEPIELDIDEAHDNTNLMRNKDHSSEGTFSRLARSVLVHEAEKSKTSDKLNERKRLLEMARKIVSTPIRSKLPPPSTSDISPISKPPQRQTACNKAGNASPWRVSDEAHLPSAFYFSRGSGNLPSFSSEFIPSTPRKEKDRNNIQSPHVPSTDLTSSPLGTNDSNGENIPPPQEESVNPVDVNTSIFDSRQNLNPRRTLARRSPLKPISILEVITLPPYEKYTNNKDKVIEDSSAKESHTSNNVDMFGFEEMLRDDDEGENICTTAQKEYTNNESLHEKLHELRKWRPANEELSHTTAPQPISRVFDENEGRPKQLRINEMLCSTMVHPPSHSDEIQDSDDDSDNMNQENELANDKEVLFKDIDPHLTFDEKTPHRTYVRPYKRKRKIRHNFVMFMDSDASSDEENNRHDVSKENVVTPKKKKKQDKPDPALDTFIREFKDMCDEVEQYEMLVE